MYLRKWREHLPQGATTHPQAVLLGAGGGRPKAKWGIFADSREPSFEKKGSVIWVNRHPRLNPG